MKASIDAYAVGRDSNQDSGRENPEASQDPKHLHHPPCLVHG